MQRRRATALVAVLFVVAVTISGGRSVRAAALHDREVATESEYIELASAHDADAGAYVDAEASAYADADADADAEADAEVDVDVEDDDAGEGEGEGEGAAAGGGAADKARDHPWPGGIVQPIDVRIKSPGPGAGRRVYGRPVDDLIARAFEPGEYKRLKDEALKKQAEKAAAWAKELAERAKKQGKGGAATAASTKAAAKAMAAVGKKPPMPITKFGHRKYTGPPLPRGYRAPPNCPTYPFCWQIPGPPAFGPAPEQGKEAGVKDDGGKKGNGGKPPDVIRINGGGGGEDE